MNDKELVSRMQHGDMQAFDELYERYKDDAYRLACLITGAGGLCHLCAVHQIAAGRQQIPAVAAQNAFPRGMEVLPQSQTGNAGLRVF